MEDALHQETRRRSSQIGTAQLGSHAQSQVTRVLPRMEPRRLLQQHLHQTQRVHPPQKPRCPKHGRSPWQDWVQERSSRVGGDLGRTAGDGGSDRDRHQGCSDPVSRLRGLAGVGRPELGLELGGQPPPPQRRQSGELSSAEQRAKISGPQLT